jgi:putative transposase
VQQRLRDAMRRAELPLPSFAVPYPKRPQIANGVYHVWTNATGGGFLALDGEDRTRFLRLLKIVVGRYHVRCYHYCVLGTHYHLVLQTPDANIGAAMRWLNAVYAQTFNKRHGRFGHLVAARYKSKIVSTSDYALEVCRYIPLNPVRAGLCERPEQWPWSSYAAILGRATVPSFLDPTWVLDQFSSDVAIARELLRAWVNEKIVATAA